MQFPSTHPSTTCLIQTPVVLSFDFFQTMLNKMNASVLNSVRIESLTSLHIVYCVVVTHIINVSLSCMLQYSVKRQFILVSCNVIFCVCERIVQNACSFMFAQLVQKEHGCKACVCVY